MKFMEVRAQIKSGKKGGAKRSKGAADEDEATLDPAKELERRMDALGPCTSAAEAIRRLCDNFLFTNAPPEALVSCKTVSPL